MNVGQIEPRHPHTPAEREDMAIVGMSCRFPGAQNYAQYWRNLSEGRSSISEVPANRWDKEAFYSPDGREPNKSTSKWGGFMDGVEYFDADFFGVSAREAAVMDPQQRIMLEQAWNCLEDAGYDPRAFSGTRTGVYIGVFTFDYRDYLGRALDAVEAHVATGTHTALIPNRISYFLNLHGPSIPVDTACSSSLVALHKAAHAIRRGECEQALVGGVSVLCGNALGQGQFEQVPRIMLITLGHVGDAEYLPTAWVVGSSFEAGIGVLYFWRIWVAVRRRQNEIVLRPQVEA